MENPLSHRQMQTQRTVAAFGFTEPLTQTAPSSEASVQVCPLMWGVSVGTGSGMRRMCSRRLPSCLQNINPSQEELPVLHN